MSWSTHKTERRRHAGSPCRCRRSSSRSQWEYQVGPCTGIDAGDQLWMSRFLLERIAEEWGIKVSFHPKPLAGDWNGAGCHTVSAALASSLQGQPVGQDAELAPVPTFAELLYCLYSSQGHRHGSHQEHD